MNKTVSKQQVKCALDDLTITEGTDCFFTIPKICEKIGQFYQIQTDPRDVLEYRLIKRYLRDYVSSGEVQRIQILGQPSTVDFFLKREGYRSVIDRH